MTAYFITSTSYQMLYNHLSDIWSHKNVFFGLMFIFFIGNLASSLVNLFIQLLIFRVITGAGGGGLQTIAQVVVSGVVSLHQRGKYQGILGISIAPSHGVGPLIGGLFSQHRDGYSKSPYPQSLYQPCSFAFMSTISGLLVSWTGWYRELVLTGWAMQAISLGLLATLDKDSFVVQPVGYSILTGVSVGQTFQPSLGTLQGALDCKVWQLLLL
ncbi:major facilitator superfamily domain-containing protein [Crucibulum laeve]|uniref:Major facilitator superfamily domain-containing protein n=1 Tax=Crucibulum laeve TaxID=68775 RepID=A0A5C3LNY2_9AGAR|nr:major facilitator superfamily domain-containing protein [Crucibulum laeve]